MDIDPKAAIVTSEVVHRHKKLAPESGVEFRHGIDFWGRLLERVSGASDIYWTYFLPNSNYVVRKTRQCTFHDNYMIF